MTLERIEHKVFASEAPLDEVGQFGSALATTKFNTKNVAEIQALPAYTKGWGSAIISGNNYPAMEEMNGVLNVMSYHTGYLYQEGIPTYSATQEYSVTSWVKDLAGEKVYKSLQGGNKGHDLTDPAWWVELKLGGGGLEIGDIGFTQMAIDESKGLRRAITKVDNIIIQEQYPELTKKLKSTQALDPDLFCTEAEWQAELSASPNGVCYKYVIDDEAGTIRLPKYPDYFDLSINAAAVSQTVSVYGNGKALGLYDGSNNAGLKSTTGTTTAAMASLYNKNVGTVASGSGLGGDKALGVVKNASTSGLTGSVTVPAVESEKIKGTYFIQVATGAETEDNIINEIELNNPFSLLDYKFSEYELNNLSWLRSESQWNAKAIYPAVYDLLLKIYNGVETKAGVSVKLVSEEYTDYDFVLNTAEETFRLQLKVKQKFLNAINGNMPVVGNGKALGLTNGSTNYGAMGDNGNGGVMLATNVYGESVGTAATVTTSNDTALGVVTNASYSGLISKISQTEVSGLYLYFYVGETVQNANLVNIGRIQETMVTRPMVDGQWVYKHQKLSTATAEGTYTLDLSSYLPNDGYVYEILCRIEYDRTTDASNAYAHLQSDIIPYNYLSVGSDNTFGGVNMIASAIIPAKDYLKLIIATGMTEGDGVDVCGYRRVGTNL